MVRGCSMGFVATGANMRTYAHELGHGAFGLEHTFPEIGQSLSNNLMDYGDSTHLTHKQCKDIAKRKFVFSWLDSEEDGSFGNFIAGAAMGGVVDLLIQTVEICINEDAKNPGTFPSVTTLISEISWGSVGISMVFGAASNGAGAVTKFRSFATSPAGKRIAKAAIENSVEFILDCTEDIIKDYVESGSLNISMKDVAESLISSALFKGSTELLGGLAAKLRKRYGIAEPKIPRTRTAKLSDAPKIDLQKVRLNDFKAKIPNKAHADGIKKYLDNSYLPEIGFKALYDDIGTARQWLGNSKLVALLADWNYYAAFYQTIGSDKYKLKVGPTGTVEELILWIIGLKEFKETRKKAVFVGMPTASVDAIDDAIDELCTIPSVRTREWINAQLAYQTYTPAQVRSFLEHVLATNNNIAVVNEAEAESNPITAPFVHAFVNDAEKTNINTWLRGMNDNRLYVALHGQGSKLFISRSSPQANGSVVSVPLTTRSLARWIKGFGTPANTEIVLLSCASEQAAQNLVNKLGGAYTVVAWTGAVRVYDNGHIQGQGVCKRYSPATSNNINAVDVTDVPKGKATAPSIINVLLAKAANSCNSFGGVKTAAERVKTTTFTDDKIDEAIDKLCVKINNTGACDSLNRQLLTYQDLEIKAFLEQIIATGDDRHISKHINGNFKVPQLTAWKKLYGSGFETDFEYIRTLSYKLSIDGVPVNVTKYDVTRIGSLGSKHIEIRDVPNSILWATITNDGNRDIITATGGLGRNGGTRRRNEILNVPILIKTAEYRVSGSRNASGRADYVTYNIDGQGRVARIRANLAALDPPGTPVVQRTPGNRDDALSSLACKANDVREGRGCGSTNGPNSPGLVGLDNGGHMIGAQFDGPVEVINYHAQDAITNQRGVWADMEREWRNQLNAGVTVEVNIQPKFSGTSKRPFEFEVRYWYNNTLQTPANNSNYQPIIQN